MKLSEELKDQIDVAALEVEEAAILQMSLKFPNMDEQCKNAIAINVGDKFRNMVTDWHIRCS